MLEAEQARLKEEIQTFQKEKDELEFILETHWQHCGPPSTVSNQTIGSTAPTSSVLIDISHSRSSSLNVTSANTTLSSVATVDIKHSVSSSVTADVTQLTAAVPSASALVSYAVGVGCRPSSLPTFSTPRTAAIATAGLNLLTVGLESLADGHTGLTPLTGIPSGPVIVVGMPMVTSSASTSDGSPSVVGYL